MLWDGGPVSRPAAIASMSQKSGSGRPCICLIPSGGPERSCLWGRRARRVGLLPKPFQERPGSWQLPTSLTSFVRASTSQGSPSSVGPRPRACGTNRPTRIYAPSANRRTSCARATSSICRMASANRSRSRRDDEPVHRRDPEAHAQAGTRVDARTYANEPYEVQGLPTRPGVHHPRARQEPMVRSSLPCRSPFARSACSSPTPPRLSGPNR